MQKDAMAFLDELLPAGKIGVQNKFNAKLTPTSPEIVAKG